MMGSKKPMTRKPKKGKGASKEAKPKPAEEKPV